MTWWSDIVVHFVGEYTPCLHVVAFSERIVDIRFGCQLRSVLYMDYTPVTHTGDLAAICKMLKRSAVRLPRKQVAVASQQTHRRVVAGTPSTPWHRSDAAQGARSIAVGSLSGYAYNLAKYRRYCLGTNKLKFRIPVIKWPHSNHDVCIISVKTFGKM